MTVLVTGGAGYIGSHTTVELLNKGYNVVIIDNLINSKRSVISNIEKITNKKVKFYQEDLTNEKAVEQIFIENDIRAVIHFAGLKAVGESVEKPLEYYRNNILSTLILCQVMQKFGCKRLVFSSSATVYGEAKKVPIKEDSPLSASNPYGFTKIMIEQILSDLYASDNQWSIISLRYFNPIGADKSGLIGDDPSGKPNNIMPTILKVAKGEIKQLEIFGNDYPTKDGTGIRDYIHVVDLSLGHIKALDRLFETTGIDAFNLGTGQGYSVLEIVNAFQKTTGIKIDYYFTHRRPGDIAESYADITKAKSLLGFKAEKTLDEMCIDSWNFASKN